MAVVADGMGGHQGGSRASELAILSVLEKFVDCSHETEIHSSRARLPMETLLRQTVRAAHHNIVRESESHPRLRGMGTTLVMAYWRWPEVWIANVGDSRCYLCRNRHLQQLTEDHTIANQIARGGGVDPAMIEKSPWSNVLWNALGADASEIHVDIYRLDLRIADRLLLCSDGLNKHLSVDEILYWMQSPLEEPQIVAGLVKAANDAGGSDNITALVLSAADSDED
jgi:PPM family protein phosphatase